MSAWVCAWHVRCIIWYRAYLAPRTLSVLDTNRNPNVKLACSRYRAQMPPFNGLVCVGNARRSAAAEWHSSRTCKWICFMIVPTMLGRPFHSRMQRVQLINIGERPRARIFNAYNVRLEIKANQVLKIILQFVCTSLCYACFKKTLYMCAHSTNNLNEINVCCSIKYIVNCTLKLIQSINHYQISYL